MVTATSVIFLLGGAGTTVTIQPPKACTPRSTSSPRPAQHERFEQLRAAQGARCVALLPRAGRPDAPGRGDGGPAADHARLQQLPRPDRRRARQAGRARRAQPLRHRADRLALPQRHDRPAPRARARARRVDGHRGRARVHDRPPGQPRRARDDPRPGRHRDRRLRRPRLDPRRLHPLAGEAAAVPPQPHRPARAHARAGRSRRRRRARRRRRRLLDGGRRRAAAGDRRAVPPVRRAADGRRGARARRARRARRRDAPSCSASRTGSTCGWPRSRSRWPPAAA